MGLLQPLTILNLILNEIYINFVEVLPWLSTFNVIMVVVDMLSKYAYFLCIKHSFIFIQILQLFVKDMVKLHRIPSTILLD